VVNGVLAFSSSRKCFCALGGLSMVENSPTYRDQYYGITSRTLIIGVFSNLGGNNFELLFYGFAKERRERERDGNSNSSKTGSGVASEKWCCE